MPRAKELRIDLACCLLARDHDDIYTTPSSPSVAPTPFPTRNSSVLHLIPSAIWLVLVASTRRLSTQKSWDTRCLLPSATPCLHATPRPFTRARKHAPTTYLSIAHFTTTPPSSILLPAPPPPLDWHPVPPRRYRPVSNTPLLRRRPRFFSLRAPSRVPLRSRTSRRVCRRCEEPGRLSGLPPELLHHCQRLQRGMDMAQQPSDPRSSDSRSS